MPADLTKYGNTYDITAKKWVKDMTDSELETYGYKEKQEEEGDEELENAVYLYICKCSGAIHDVPFGIHEKIKLQGKKFKCKKCREALEFYKVYSEGF